MKGMKLHVAADEGVPDEYVGHGVLTRFLGQFLTTRRISKNIGVIVF